MAPRDPNLPDASKPATGRARPGGARAAAAMLGSVAALGAPGSALAQATTGHTPRTAERRQARRAQDALPAGERALLSAVFGALSQQAPAIAAPVLAQGVAAGTISQAQEDAFLARLASVKAAAGGSGQTAGAGQPAAPAEVPPSPAAQTVFQQALGAIRAGLPTVARPLVDAALADGSITEAQATRLSARFEAGPRLGFGLVLRGARAVGATRLP